MGSSNEKNTQRYAADIQSIKEAQVRISPYIHKTPVLSSTYLNSEIGRQLFFKCECFQKGGAFKIRGASNAIFSLDDNEVSKGVVTHSSGNHAAAVSLAAKLSGLSFMIGGALSFLAADMTPLTAVFFFSFATIKTVDDHCGLWLPGNVLHVFFWNNSAFHDIHHQLYGNKYNFSQPFFATWDKFFGTHMDYSLEKRDGGGFEARPVKKID